MNQSPSPQKTTISCVNGITMDLNKAKEIPLSEIKALHALHCNGFETEVIMKDLCSSYLCQKTIAEILNMPRTSHIMILDDQIDDFVTYEESKLPPNKARRMSYIPCARMNCQGHISRDGDYEMTARSVFQIRACNKNLFKTELLAFGSNWGVFTRFTIPEIMNMRGINKEALIWDETYSNYVTYKIWCLNNKQ